MNERVRFITLYVHALCVDGPTAGALCWYERIESPMPGQQKTLVRRARQHARATGHRVSIERGQSAGIEA